MISFALARGRIRCSTDLGLQLRLELVLHKQELVLRDLCLQYLDIILNWHSVFSSTGMKSTRFWPTVIRPTVISSTPFCSIGL